MPERKVNVQEEGKKIGTCSLKRVDASQQSKEEGTKNYPDLKQNNGYIFEKGGTRSLAGISCTQTCKCIRAMGSSIAHAYKISAFLTNVPGTRSGLLILLGC